MKSHISSHLMGNLVVEPNALPLCAKLQVVTTHICMVVWVSVTIYPLGTWENAQASSTFGRGFKSLARATQQVSSSIRARTSDACSVTPSLHFLGMFGLVTHLSYASAHLSVLTGPPSSGPSRFTGWNPTSSQNLQISENPSAEQNLITFTPSMCGALYKLQRTFTCMLSLDRYTNPVTGQQTQAKGPRGELTCPKSHNLPGRNSEWEAGNCPHPAVLQALTPGLRAQGWALGPLLE